MMTIPSPKEAAVRVIQWMRAVQGTDPPSSVTDLDLIRQMLPTTPYGKGVKEIKPPMPATWPGAEGALVRNPHNPEEWGIFYAAKAPYERQRFTIAHELGHFILHRHQQHLIQCGRATVYSGGETILAMEREANVFASNVLMPGDLFHEAVRQQGAPIRIQWLSDLAHRFEVSFEALCLRFLEFTPQRAILLCWDGGFLDYQARSKSAVRTRAWFQRTTDPQEPPPGSLAADLSIAQEWEGVKQPASLWCAEEGPQMSLREYKHTYAQLDRVLTLLILESAEPRPRDRSWHDEPIEDCADRFNA